MADNGNEEPVLRNAGAILPKADKIGPKLVEKTDKLEKKVHKNDDVDEKEKKKPAGGFDDTPVPRAAPGYTIKITIHKAENLPFADIGTLSSDPYVLAVLRTDLPKRHKQDPDLTLRTPTIHRNTDPVWETEWIVANVPTSGFKLKCRLYDEDPSDHDDRLGNAHVDVGRIDNNWKGFSNRSFQLKKRMGSKRAYTLRGCAALLSKNVKMSGHLFVSVENLGRTETDNGGRAYTIGPLPWTRHYSPLIGRIAGTKDTEQGKDGKETQRYNFQSVQMQFRGPVPAEMYHRYVEFSSFVGGMFTGRGVRGRLLNMALHHQHARIYNFDGSTKYGSFAEPSPDMTQQFLELCHYDEGGRIFTYVLTLDGQLRFTETGKEFGIDLLSKHTMHSDVSIYIAFSGEFFIRRIKHPRAHKDDQSVDPQKETHPPSTPPGNEQDQKNTGEDKRASSDRPKSSQQAANGSASQQPNIEGAAGQKDKDPTHYELIIDNDSGTYRPNAKTLPSLQKFLLSNLPGLKVKVLDCQADEELQQSLKKEQREKKKAFNDGKRIMYMQNTSTGSISSSDEEELDARAAAAEDGTVQEKRYKREMHKFMDGGRDEHHGGVEPVGHHHAHTQGQHDTSPEMGEGNGLAEKGKERVDDGPTAAGQAAGTEQSQLSEKQ